MHIQILLYDGFNERDALTPLEVLTAAGLPAAAFRVDLVRIAGGTVTSALGLQLHVPAMLDPAFPPDLLLLPGGGWLAGASENAWASGQRDKIAAAVAAMRQAGSAVAAVGSGTLFLAAADLLRGRPAVAHHQVLDDVAAAGADIVRARVVDDGDLLTAAGATGGLDLALWLVERHVGPAFAHALEQRLEYERRGTVWRRPGP
jgi:transcriptional regulator GlxA family with amidase domain